MCYFVRKISENLNLHLLVLCCILCQGIFAKLSDKDNRESSDFVVRKRRVVNHVPGQSGTTPITRANYIVNIRENQRNICAGVILSHYNVLTGASCVAFDVSVYKVSSGSAFEPTSTKHSVTSKAEYHGHPPHQRCDGIVLITVDPPFQYSRYTGYLPLREEPLAIGTHATVIGWGCTSSLYSAPVTRRRLCSINLPIMNHRECQNEYGNRFNITEKHICTYDERQYCCHGDVGAPLVVNNMLAGIHVYKGQNVGARNPDVYIDLHRPEYRTWIMENSFLM